MVAAQERWISAVLCCAVLCCAVLCCAVPCRAVPCRAVHGVCGCCCGVALGSWCGCGSAVAVQCMAGQRVHAAAGWHACVGWGAGGAAVGATHVHMWSSCHPPSLEVCVHLQLPRRAVQGPADGVRWPRARARALGLQCPQHGLPRWQCRASCDLGVQEARVLDLHLSRAQWPGGMVRALVLLAAVVVMVGVPGGIREDICPISLCHKLGSRDGMCGAVAIVCTGGTGAQGGHRGVGAGGGGLLTGAVSLQHSRRPT
jgi:hypothetical protein